ncbi:MAG: lipoyl(octanoyl) transferase LipB [Chthoniobacterales bacterium]
MSTLLQTEWLGQVDYDEGLTIQEQYVKKIDSGESPETLLLLEHHPIFTIGRTRDDSSLKKDTVLPYPVRQTNRGGQATYHGPGQLVGYPILNLRNRVQDLHRYLRFLEIVLIETLAEGGIDATSRDALTGVWVQKRKIASIGVGVRKWVTMHGFALNVTNESLTGFQSIIPCGIADVEMTCVEREIKKESSVREVSRIFSEKFQDRLSELLPSVK